jgi:hypothetical protein
MMTLAFYVWRDWRAHRRTLAWLGTLSAVCVGLSGWVIPSRALAEPWVLLIASLLGAFAVLVTVGTELLPNELRAARIRYLERLPRGLSGAFVAKLIVFALTLLLGAAFGFLLVVLASFLRSGELPREAFDGYGPACLVFFTGLALWIFTVSSWVPSTLLAILAALLLLVLLGWAVVLDVAGWLPLEPTLAQAVTLLALSLVGAPVCAWVSFVHGYGKGGGSARAACRGLPVASVFLAPGWLWASSQLASLSGIDPQAEDFEIHSAVLHDDGLHVSLLANRSYDNHRGHKFGPSHLLEVDLRDGSWRELETPTVDDWNKARHHGIQDRIEGRTDVPIPLGRSGEELHATIESLRAELPDTVRVRGRAGFGLLLVQRQFSGGVRPWGVLDPLRRENLEASELGLESDDLASFHVLPTAWLCFVDGDSREGILIDPTTRERRSSFVLAPRESLGPLLPDGRFLLVRDEAAWALDPVTGSTTAFAIAGVPGSRVRWAHELSEVGEAPISQLVVGLHLDGIGTVVSRIDLARAVILPTLGSRETAHPVGLSGDQRVITLEFPGTLVELTFGSDERRVLFPR